jgi:hypothetical protein
VFVRSFITSDSSCSGSWKISASVTRYTKFSHKCVIQNPDNWWSKAGSVDFRTPCSSVHECRYSRQFRILDSISSGAVKIGSLDLWTMFLSVLAADKSGSSGS